MRCQDLYLSISSIASIAILNEYVPGGLYPVVFIGPASAATNGAAVKARTCEFRIRKKKTSPQLKGKNILFVFKHKHAIERSYVSTADQRDLHPLVKENKKSAFRHFGGKRMPAKSSKRKAPSSSSKKNSRNKALKPVHIPTFITY